MLEKIEAILDINRFEDFFLLSCGAPDKPLELSEEIIADIIYDRLSFKLSVSECNLLAHGGFRLCDFRKLLSSHICDILRVNEGKVSVRFEKWVEWKKTIFRNGEDMFVACFIATNGLRTDVWPTLISSDNKALNEKISLGAADNHYHLSGSGPIFLANWFSIHSLSFAQLLRHVGKRNRGRYSQRLKKALPLLIKIVLCSKLLRNALRKDCASDAVQTRDWNDAKAFLKEEDLSEETLERYKEFLIDDFSKGTSSLSEFIAEERELLCKCFLKYEGWSTQLQASFVSYLIAKRRIASFFVQNNEFYGLLNFDDYCASKYFFIPTKEYPPIDLGKEAISIAFSDCALKYLEIRITTSLKENEFLSGIKNVTDVLESGVSPLNKRVGFVISMTKPKLLSRNNAFGLKDYFSYVNKIMTLTHAETAACDFITGFDCCGVESNCKPEFFAPVFSFIRNRKKRYGLTYHVGEDFITLAQGIRSVYEAVLFLNLGSGDRLGHACALGTEPKRYFDLKGKTVSETNQDALDDYCFFSFVYSECGDDTKSSFWRLRALPLLRDLYDSDDFDSYLKSIRLRGVAKDIWDVEYGDYYACHDYFANQGKGDYIPEYLNVKDIWEKPFLTFAREYAQNVPNADEKANEICRLHIDEAYIAAIEKAQTYVLQKIVEKGIIIETNPTSNYLIGPFYDFEDIPVFSFLKNNDLPIRLTIGTDDSGLFSIDLRGEYTSVYYSLVGEEGEKLKQVRKLCDESLCASFPKAHES